MTLKLNADQVNYLNAGLMVLSAGLAFVYPFELFLFVYTVLGPLHYLTEISWLHDRGYYTKGKYDFLFLVAAGMAVTVLNLFFIQDAPQSVVEFVTYMAFVAALVFVVLNRLFERLVALTVAAGAAFFLAQFHFYASVFAVFLPTLVHVFVFTGLFILVGALRSKSFSGGVSLLVFLVLAGSFIFVHPTHADYHIADYVKANYGFLKDDGSATSPFIGVNFYFLKDFHLHDFAKPFSSISDYVNMTNNFLYHNPLALALMSFIAFAYTYHYLNWFSKTSIIRWHEISRRRFTAVWVVWGLSLVIYAYNYSLGFRWLFFLSLSHVFLEFPLNHLTFIGLFKELRKNFHPAQPNAQ